MQFRARLGDHGRQPGGIIGFTGVGKCPSRARANKCRVNARKAIERCVRTQYEKRWEHHPFNSDGSPSPDYDRGPPEACLRAANIEGYSLKKVCWNRPISARVCHNRTNADVLDSADPDDLVEVSTAGDIKRALETSVCCFKNHGLQQFPNEEKVHVRLIAESSSRRVVERQRPTEEMQHAA